MRKEIDVCLTPELVHLSDLSNKLVVVVDIFRATSCMVSGLASGVKSITPVATVEECLSYRPQGHICAGERGGKKIPEFDIGNSPFEYMDDQTRGRNIAVSTTNGTLAIKKSADATEIVIGSFLNLSAIVDYVINSEMDVVIHCAGWKGTFNLEDTTFAGALIDRVSEKYHFKTDASFMAVSLWHQANSDLYQFLLKSAHAERLKKFGIEKDLKFCSELDHFNIVPILKDRQITV